MTLQQQQQEEQQFLPCGKKYLRKTIGLSITDNHLYQFLLMNKKIQIIRYDYHKLFENNDENDYTLNLIDGLVLTNGLNDLIPENVVRQLMTIVLWNNGGGGGGNEEEPTTNSDNENDIESIISMSMSINRKGKIHIHLVKTLDQYNYTIGDYNQDVNMTVMDIFYSSYPVKYNIMGTISDYNYGIITLFYNKLSYRMKIFKLKETKNFGNLSFKWQYNLIIDSVNDNLIRQIHKKPCDQEDDDGNTELKTFTKLFEQIFGKYTFTYGFIDEKKIFLFSNQNKTLMRFSADMFEHKTDHKYSFQLKLYDNFFYCITKKDKNDENLDIDLITKKHKENFVTKQPIENKDNNQTFFNNKINLIMIAIFIFIIILSLLFIFGYRNRNYFQRNKQKQKESSKKMTIPPQSSSSSTTNPITTKFINKTNSLSSSSLTQQSKQKTKSITITTKSNRI